MEEKGMIAETEKTVPFYIRAPATTIIVLHYGAFILGPAIFRSNPQLNFILGIYVTVVLACALGELALKRPHNSAKDSNPRGPTPLISKTIFGVGLAATFLASLGGSNSYAVQMGQRDLAGWVSLVTPFTSWLLLGFFLMLACCLRGEVSRKQLLIYALLACGVQFALGLRGGLINTAASFAICVLLALLLSQVIRPKIFVVAGITLLIAWPVAQEARNQLRAEIRGSMAALGSPTSSLERFWIDKQLADAQHLHESGIPVDPPTWATVIRTGLIPSALDTERPPIDTGSRLSIALGGDETNSTSTTMPGNIWLFGGLASLVAFYALLGFTFARMLFSNSAWILALGGFSYLYLMSFSASYPDALVRLLQAVVSMALAGALAIVMESPAARKARKKQKSAAIPLGRR